MAALSKAAATKPKTYGGLILFIDEMGKFLGAAAQDGSDIYVLQQLAEAASRSQSRQLNSSPQGLHSFWPTTISVAATRSSCRPVAARTQIGCLINSEWRKHPHAFRSTAISSVGRSRKSAASARRIVIVTRSPSDQLTSNPDVANVMKPAARTTVVVSNAWPTT